MNIHAATAILLSFLVFTAAAFSFSFSVKGIDGVDEFLTELPGQGFFPLAVLVVNGFAASQILPADPIFTNKQVQ